MRDCSMVVERCGYRDGVLVTYHVCNRRTYGHHVCPYPALICIVKFEVEEIMQKVYNEEICSL